MCKFCTAQVLKAHCTVFKTVCMSQVVWGPKGLESTLRVLDWLSVATLATHSPTYSATYSTTYSPTGATSLDQLLLALLSSAFSWQAKKLDLRALHIHDKMVKFGARGELRFVKRKIMLKIIFISYFFMKKSHFFGDWWFFMSLLVTFVKVFH